jgi:Icc-related predicted phosphoesterase
MKIDCISDLHGYYPELEGGDLLIVAGDLTTNDTFPGYVFFDNWLKSQDYKKKIFIAGNHDNQLQKYITHISYLEDDGKTIYLCDSGTEFSYWERGKSPLDRASFQRTIKIWGSPWTHLFPGVNPHCKAFMLPEFALADKWALIPDDTDILITHSPPKGIMDTIKTRYPDGYITCCGSESLYQRLNGLKNLKLHVFGHIHEGHGHIPAMQDFPGVQFVNASHVDGDYEPVNKPIGIIL